jgi:hypothetical protein
LFTRSPYEGVSDMRVEKLKSISNEELVSGEWLPIKEVAKKKGKTIPTICNWVDRGDLEARKHFGRIFVKLIKD